MIRPAPDETNHIVLIGAGNMGAGWAAHFLAQGKDVVATDPGGGAEERLRAVVDNAWPILTELGLAAGADRDRLRFVPTLEEAVDGADFVQENAPEDEALKIALLARIDAVLAPNIVIASSTSAFRVSNLQSACRHPERCVLGHPFNPPYLVPLVEVGGGKQTDPVAVDWAMAFYAAVGQHPIRLKREIHEHVANRLQSVVGNEAVNLVEGGVASAEDVDAAITYGPGLRWAFMGPFLTRHLAGGEGGIARALEMFGRPIEHDPDEIPRLPQSLEGKARLIQGIGEAIKGRSISELERQRNRCLVAIRKALREVATADP